MARWLLKTIHISRKETFMIEPNKDDTGNLNMAKDTLPKGIQPDEMPVLFLNQHTIIPGCTIPVSDHQNIAEIGQIQATKLSEFATFTRLDNQHKSDLNKLHVSGFGCISQVAGAVQQQEGKVAVLVRGIERAKLLSVRKKHGIYWGKVEALAPPKASEGIQVTAQIRTLESMLTQLGQIGATSEIELALRVLQNEELHIALYLISLNLNLSKTQLSAVLGQNKLEQLIAFLITRLGKEVEVAKLSRKIHKKVQSGIDSHIKRSFLREQMQKIRTELKNLGDNLDNDENDELAEFKKFAANKKTPKDLKKLINREIHKIESSPAGSPDTGIALNFLQFATELPWGHLAKPKQKLKELSAQKLISNSQGILDKDHFGLKKVKQRVLESLLAQHQTKNHKSGAILFVGPPGVGKTSLTKSIAKALGRQFTRVALGGVSDEAEIRGHRRTYVGAMPGRILEAIHKAGTTHTVMLLDEIDKAGQRGSQRNVSSALLELLDPSQNDGFSDHFLGYPFDFSEVMFVGTANSLKEMDPALIDRMEVIELSSYTINEKAHIGCNYLLPNSLNRYGLKAEDLPLTLDDMKYLVSGYTQEAGVRELERTIKSLARKYLFYKVNHSSQYKKQAQLSSREWIPKLLEAPRFDKDSRPLQISKAGLATGLAYTRIGGDVLFIETTLLPMSPESENKPSNALKNLVLTGSLGKVMQESAQTALSFILSNYRDLNLNIEPLYQNQIHIHLPDGATPKDGPSAGITILSAIISLIRNRPLPNDFAMTGEITLRGEVLPVGGIKEKVIAAHNRGYRNIILPLKNWTDLKEVDPEIREQLEFFPVSEMHQVPHILGLYQPKGNPNKISPVVYTSQSWHDLLPTTPNNSSKVYDPLH